MPDAQALESRKTERTEVKAALDQVHRWRLEQALLETGLVCGWEFAQGQ